MIDTAELVAAIRLKSGLKNNQYFKDADLAGFASDGAAELFDLIVKAQENYFRRDFDFTLAGGVGGNTVKRPLDYYKAQLLELNPDAPYPVTVTMLGELGAKNRAGAFGILTNGAPARQYTVDGDTIEILPAPAAAGVYRMRYTPILEKLVLPNAIDLTTSYTPGPVDVTARLYMSQSITDPGGSVFTGAANEMIVIVPNTTPALLIDGRTPNVGDIILIPLPTAPATFREGLWVYNGLTATGAELQYRFDRLTGYQEGANISAGLRVKISDGAGFAGTIWSNDALWHVNTNEVNWVRSLETPIITRVMTTSPLPGSWISSDGGNTLTHTDIFEVPDPLKIDGEDMSPGDLAWFASVDAPINGSFCGIWQFIGLSNVTNRVFKRPAGYLVGDTQPTDTQLTITDGATARGVTLANTGLLIGITTDDLAFALNSLKANGLVVLQNAELDPSYVGGTLSIEGSPLGDRTYTIVSYIDETSITVAATGNDTVLAENFGAPTLIHATRQGERYTIPQEMLPWQDYIVIHASISVQQGRQQSSAALERKLEELKVRIAGMAMNRSADVIQAPITRHLRNRGWGGLGGTGGGW